MNRLGIVQPEKLPYFAVLETIDTEDIIDARMKRLVALWKGYDPPAGAIYDVEGLEFDPIKINQELCTYFELMLRDRVNQACRAVTTAYAVDGDLDTIATRYPGGVPRLERKDADGNVIWTEDDDSYRRRIWLSPSTLSPHGLEESYVFWALTCDPTLRDASATTREGTGQVNVTIMAGELTGQAAWDNWQRGKTVWGATYIGGTPRPTDVQLLTVRAYLHEHARKGLTDIVSVLSPTIKHTRFVLDVWLYPGMDSTVIMPTVRKNLQDLNDGQHWLGFDYTRMAIATACGNVNGVQNVHILEPQRSIEVDLRGCVSVSEIELNMRGFRE